MPTPNVNTMNTTIHTDELTSVQNSNNTQMAEISVGMDSQFP